jgi:hypothetical protein
LLGQEKKPKNSAGDFYEESAKRLPVMNFDVVVAGGGTAGVVAARAVGCPVNGHAIITLYGARKITRALKGVHPGVPTMPLETTSSRSSRDRSWKVSLSRMPWTSEPFKTEFRRQDRTGDIEGEARCLKHEVGSVKDTRRVGAPGVAQAGDALFNKVPKTMNSRPLNEIPTLPWF